MKKIHMLALALFAAAGAAQAQPYVLLSAGSARLNVDCTGTTSCDSRGTGFKVMGGWKFLPSLAAEVGYFDYGKAKASAGGVTAEIATTGFGAGVAFLQDISTDWNFAGRLGVASVKTKISGTAGGASGSDSSTNTAPYAGLSIGYKLSKTVSIDAAWDLGRSKYAKNGTDTSGNVNVLSLGVTMGF
jgi:OOP family OmpA-OmpF porin